MRRLWTTAAAAALCVFAADAWAAPSGGQLTLAATHHQLRGSQDEVASASKHAKGKAKAKGKSKAAASPAHGRRARHGKAEPAENAHARRGHHPVAAASDEAPRAKGRHGRHHVEEASPEPAHGRHGRHGHAPSEIHTASGGTVEVGRHDTLESISHDTGVTIPELAKLNHLKKPFRIRKGAELKLPERRYYVVKSGDTISSLARKFDVETSELSGANAIARGHGLRAGQKLYLPGGAHEAAPPEEQAAPPPRRPTPRNLPPSIIPTLPIPSERPYAKPSQPTAPEDQTLTSSTPSSQGFETVPTGPRPYQPSATTPGRAIIQTGPAPSAADVATAGKGKFIWPVSGQVVQGFGPKADGQRNDGLNITADAGDPVRAAADGEVVYAGDQVPSFGNLVLIKHPGGWVTAYAHMGRIQVKNRDQVVQGQQIGSVGQTGQVDRPQLHFEIRYAPSPKDKATPVDPGLVLPGK